MKKFIDKVSNTCENQIGNIFYKIFRCNRQRNIKFITKKRKIKLTGGRIVIKKVIVFKAFLRKGIYK